jgi:hypothetical protein
MDLKDAVCGSNWISKPRFKPSRSIMFRPPANRLTDTVDDKFFLIFLAPNENAYGQQQMHVFSRCMTKHLSQVHDASSDMRRAVGGYAHR